MTLAEEKKLSRRIRKLTILGLSKKEATERVGHLQIKDWDEQARNAELVNTYRSNELGAVTVPA